jgi:hypothetical protein
MRQDRSLLSRFDEYDAKYPFALAVWGCFAGIVLLAFAGLVYLFVSEAFSSKVIVFPQTPSTSIAPAGGAFDDE